MSVLDRDLLSEIQTVLIEPPDGGDTWPSLIWTRVEVLSALNAALRGLVRDVQLTAARTELPVAAGATGVSLPADTLATAALVWRDTLTNVRTPLGLVDSFESDLADPGWETSPGLPLGVADLDTTRLSLRLVPTPAGAGVLEVVYIQVPPVVIGNGSPLPVATEVTPGVKYATLAILLRKVGRLLDEERANYCDRRYELTTVVSEILLAGWA